ncbi:MAG: metalloregulator ArsR/SmtB family transcription factor [Desulfobulbaceae bacterium]|nr:metalloregulator ArsR/SmtB family transcription factor [Desulfobulbaceae bacterium]
MKKRYPGSANDLCQVRCIHEDRIDRAAENALQESEHISLSQLFKAMGDITRLKILTALDNDEMCVCDLAAYLGISESAVSHQLRQLRQLHLVANRRQGPILYYRLVDDHVGKLVRLGLEHIRE